MCSRTAPIRRACFRCLRWFSLFSGLERRRSGGLASRTFARVRPRVDPSRRRRGLKRVLAQVRIGCQQLRLGGIDVLMHRRRCQSHTELRSRDTWSGGAAIAVLRDTRALILAAPKKQQECRSNKAYQGERRSRRHVASCALSSCTKVPESTPPNQAPPNVLPLSCRGVRRSRATYQKKIPRAAAPRLRPGQLQGRVRRQLYDSLAQLGPGASAVQPDRGRHLEQLRVWVAPGRRKVVALFHKKSCSWYWRRSERSALRALIIRMTPAAGRSVRGSTGCKRRVMSLPSENVEAWKEPACQLGSYTTGGPHSFASGSAGPSSGTTPGRPRPLAAKWPAWQQA